MIEWRMAESNTVRKIIVHIFSHNWTCVCLENIATIVTFEFPCDSCQSGRRTADDFDSHLKVFCRAYTYSSGECTWKWICLNLSPPAVIQTMFLARYDDFRITVHFIQLRIWIKSVLTGICPWGPLIRGASNLVCSSVDLIF